jgi:hypothetical protein
MAPQHGLRRARIAFSGAAAKQLENLTTEAEIHALDRALVVISVDPEIAEPIPGDTAGPQLSQYADEVDGTIVISSPTSRSSRRRSPGADQRQPAQRRPGAHRPAQGVALRWHGDHAPAATGRGAG